MSHKHREDPVLVDSVEIAEDTRVEEIEEIHCRKTVRRNRYGKHTDINQEAARNCRRV